VVVETVIFPSPRSLYLRITSGFGMTTDLARITLSQTSYLEGDENPLYANGVLNKYKVSPIA